MALSPVMAAPRPAHRWSWPRRLGLHAIRGYQRWISPRLAIRCRYVPSCSQYGAEAVQRYGLIAGSRIALGRILSCTDGVAYGTHDPLQD
jgi:putative membrane protein insertion efficiency factor